MTATTAAFTDLFFSEGVIPTGSVREYYLEVSGGLVELVGQVVGPIRMPQTLAWYANGNYGIGKPTGTARAQDLARDAAVAADPTVDFSDFDNDRNGYVDAFVVVHAGPDGAATLDPNDIWSHKYVLPSVYQADNAKVYAYLTISEDSTIGVCAHELGHLLFRWIDLYDTDWTSEGVGDWCLMGSGSWNGTPAGTTPAHPSAWCKLDQGWVSATAVTKFGSQDVLEVTMSRNVLRLWTDGLGGPEYFLVENRQRTGFDAALPGDGLLLWHVDETQQTNTDENHYRVGLVQADGNSDLNLGNNRGDAGDPFPGSSNKSSASATSTPSTQSYTGQATCVRLSGISGSSVAMTANIAVSCGVRKLTGSGGKSGLKDVLFELAPPVAAAGELGKGATLSGADLHPLSALLTVISDAAAALQRLIGPTKAAVPFIGPELRPDVLGTAWPTGDDLVQRMAQADPTAKRTYDNMPP
jgi:immune inhibitor A